jgi:hypothetical protein
MIAKGADCH